MSMLTRISSRRALAAPLLSARHLATRRVLPAGTRIPTAEDAASLPRHVRELSGEALLILVKSGPEDSSAARERLLPPAAADNATVADVAAFLDRLADHARAVSYAPRDVATALWACAKIAEAVESCVEVNQ